MASTSSLSSRSASSQSNSSRSTTSVSSVSSSTLSSLSSSSKSSSTLSTLSSLSSVSSSSSRGSSGSSSSGDSSASSSLSTSQSSLSSQSSSSQSLTSGSSQSASSGSSLSSGSSSQSSSSSSTEREFQPNDLTGCVEFHPFYDIRRYTYDMPILPGGFLYTPEEIIGEGLDSCEAFEGNSFTTSAANPPLRDQFNGRGGVRCVGNDRAVFIPAMAASIQRATFFILLRVDNHFEIDSGSTNVLFLYRTDTTNSKGLSISFDDTDQTYVVAFGPLSEGIKIPQRRLSGETLLTIEFDTVTDNTVTVWVNGGLFDSVRTTQGNLGSDANEACFQSMSDGDNTFGGFVAFNTVLSDSRRQDVEAFLVNKVTSGGVPHYRSGPALVPSHKWHHGDIDRQESSGSSSSNSSSLVSESSMSTGTTSSSSGSSSSSTTLNFSTSSKSSSVSSSSQSSGSSSNSSSVSSSSVSSSTTSVSSSSSSSKNSSSSTFVSSSSQSRSGSSQSSSRSSSSSRGSSASSLSSSSSVSSSSHSSST